MSILKRVFFGWPFFVLLILVWLTFFQHPSGDDFAGYLLTRMHGFRGAASYYLSGSNGRFSSIPLFLFFTSSRFLMEHYFAGLIFFLLLAYLGIWYFLKYVLKTCYTIEKPPVYYHWLTAFSLLVLLTCMPEPSSFFSWLATDTTYLISFILFLFYLVKLHQVFILPRAGSRLRDRPMLVLLVWLVGGTNEIALFFSVFFSGLLLGYRFFWRKDRSPFLLAVLLMHVLVVVLEFSLSGNIQRSGGYVQKQSWLFSAAGAFYQSVQVFFSVFSNPLFWMAGLWMLYNSRHIKASVKVNTARPVVLFAAALLLLFAGVFVVSFMARHFTATVLPLRARNIIVCILIPSMLASAALLIGPLLPAMAKTPAGNSWYWLAGILLLVFNPFTAGLCQSIVNAPVHHEVLNNRIVRIREARAHGLRKVELNTYQDDFLAVMKKKYGTKAALFFNVEYPPPPRYLYFLDEPAKKVTGNLYSEYYGIDTLQLKNNVVVRIGLMPGIWQNKVQPE